MINLKNCPKDDAQQSKSSDESESENEADNDIEYEQDMEKIDIDALKWAKDKIEFKYKNGHLKYKYKIEGLKEGKVYLIRIKAKNSSGTTKCAKIKFDKHNKMYVTGIYLDRF